MADKPTDFYRMRAKVLEKQLEHEQEWETYFPGITNREYSTYADTCACGMARRLDEIEAADLVASWCGFQRERITIVTTEKPLERNRHGDIRCKDGITNYDRRQGCTHSPCAPLTARPVARAASTTSASRCWGGSMS